MTSPSSHPRLQQDHPIVLPPRLPVRPLRQTAALPFIGIPRSIKLIEDAVEHDNLFGWVTRRNPEQEPSAPAQLHTVGTVAGIHRQIRGRHECTNIIVEGLERMKVSAGWRPSLIFAPGSWRPRKSLKATWSWTH